MYHSNVNAVGFVFSCRLDSQLTALVNDKKFPAMTWIWPAFFTSSTKIICFVEN